MKITIRSIRHIKLRRMLIAVSTWAISACVPIGDIGGPGHMLSTLITDGFRTEAAPAFRAEAIPNKIRIGHLGNECVRWYSRNCIEITAGIEIEKRQDLIRVFEERIKDPCVLLSTPFGESAPQFRRAAYSDFFDCGNPLPSRAVRYIELQIVSDPTPQKPQIHRVKTYRIPAEQ